MNKFIVNPSVAYDYAKVEKCVQALAKRYSKNLCVSDLYRSTQGRKICVLKLGKGAKKILFTAAIHGREYVSTSFLFCITEFYARAIESGRSISGEDIRKIFREYSFYIVPASNPDSVEIALGKEKPNVDISDFCAYTFKDNANGVNINANFPFCWDEVPKDRHKGGYAASEKETRNLINLCEKYDFQKMLTLHSRGGCVFWRDSGNGVVGSDQTLAKKIEKKCGLYLCPVTEDIKAYSGGFENWFRHRFRKAAICVELVSDENAPFDLCCRKFFEYTDWKNTKNLFLSVV